MDRRTFVVAGSAALAAAATASWYYLANTRDAWPATLVLIWEPDTIIDIGKKYRAAFPEEDDKGKLSKLLHSVEGADLESMVKSDFAAGRTIQVDGWIISLTEARLCALASFSS